MLDPNYQKLMEYALRALSRRAHTVFEIQEKLKKRPQHSEALEKQIIARLKELNLLNDEAFVRRTIENAMNFKLEGPYKVAQKNSIKGIPLDETNRLWKKMKVDERKIAEKALKKMNLRLKKHPREKHYQKRAQFLAGRGFSPDVIFDLAKNHEIS